MTERPEPGPEFFGVGWREPTVSADLPLPDGRRGARLLVASSLRSGLPLEALQSARVTQEDLDASGVASTDLTPPLWRGWVVGGRAFPLVPIWPGFAADTVLYAGAALAALSGPGVIRRRLRRSRGRCGGCGYELRGSTGEACPECGAGGSEP